MILFGNLNLHGFFQHNVSNTIIVVLSSPFKQMPRVDDIELLHGGVLVLMQ